MTETQWSFSRREFLIFLFKYRARLAAAFFIPLLLSVAASFIPTPRYQADSVLIVRLGAEYVYQPETGGTINAPVSAIPFDREQIFKSEVAILNSRNLHEQVIQEIGVERLFPSLTSLSNLVELRKKWGTEEEAKKALLGKAVEAFDKRFGLALGKDSAVINISYEHQDPKVAAEVLTVLIRNYFGQRRHLYLDPRTNVAEGEVAKKKERVAAALKALDDFKRKNRLYSLEDQRKELLERRNSILEKSSSISNPGLEQKLAEYNSQLRQLDAQGKELAKLAKELEIAENAYSLYSHKLDEAETYESIQNQKNNSVRVIQQPTVAPEPKSRQLMIIAIGFFMSVLSMLAVAAVTEFSRSGFLTPEEIERHIRLPVLAAIPLYDR